MTGGKRSKYPGGHAKIGFIMVLNTRIFMFFRVLTYDFVVIHYGQWFRNLNFKKKNLNCLIFAISTMKTNIMKTLFQACIAFFLIVSCGNNPIPQNISQNVTLTTDTAVFANGCFWCTEAIFEQLNGVLKVTPGYTGGNTPKPTYSSVSKGTTGHAECLQIIYDTSIISFDELLEVFWETHDPTTLNRQGADVGTQYRSAVFYMDDTQFKKAQHYKDKLNANNIYDKPVVTEITAFENFYPAENEHHQYYARNKNAPYCRAVITPKIEKFRKVFKEKLKQ